MSHPSNPPNPGNPPQTLTVQYDGVTVFDGTTPSVAFSRDPSSPLYIEPDANGIYHVPQNGPLGLIDPDLGVGGSMGDRWIPWLLVVPDAADNIVVQTVDAENDVFLETVEPLQLVVQSLFRNRRFRVPQGGLIRVSGDAGIGGRLRLRIMLEPDTCCDADAGSSSGDVVVDQNQQFMIGGQGTDVSADVPLLFTWASGEIGPVPGVEGILAMRRAVTISGVALTTRTQNVGVPLEGTLSIIDNGATVYTSAALVLPGLTSVDIPINPPVSIDAMHQIQMAFTPSDDYGTVAISGAVDATLG